MLEMSTFPAPLPVPDPTLLGLLAPRLKLEISIAFSCPFVVDSPSTPGIFRKISLAIRVSSSERQFFSKPAGVTRVRGRQRAYQPLLLPTSPARAGRLPIVVIRKAHRADSAAAERRLLCKHRACPALRRHRYAPRAAGSSLSPPPGRRRRRSYSS